jgi:hypothetical protein
LLRLLNVARLGGYFDAIPHAHAEDADDRETLLRIVSGLPEKRRDAILMFYYDEMSYAEIAEAMDVSVSTVSTNILRAKKTIKKAYERYTEKREERDVGKMRVGDMRYAPGMESGVLALLPGVLQGEAHHLVAKSDVELLMNSVKPLLSSMKAAAGIGAGHGNVVDAAGAVNPASSASLPASAAAATKMLVVATCISAAASLAAIPVIGPAPARIQPAAGEYPPAAYVADVAAPGDGAVGGTYGSDKPGGSEAPPVGGDTPVAQDSDGGDRPAKTGSAVATDTQPYPSSPHTALPSTSPAPAAGAVQPAVTYPPADGSAAEIAAPSIEAPAAIMDPDLPIVFTGGDCPCGHVNPDSAVIGGEHSEGDVSWRVMEEDKNDILFSGTGAVIEEPMAKLAGQGREGSYVIEACVVDPGGGEWRSSVNFIIFSQDATL